MTPLALAVLFAVAPLRAQVKFVDQEAQRLDAVAASAATDAGAVASQAHDFWGPIPDRRTTQIDTYVPRNHFIFWQPWGRTSVDYTVKGISKAVRDVLKGADMPALWEHDVHGAYFKCEQLRNARQVQYDGDNGHQPFLAEYQMGAFKYQVGHVASGNKALGIFLNKLLGDVAKQNIRGRDWKGKPTSLYIGEEYIGATYMHECGHYRDHGNGELTPAQVIDGEIRAFRAECRYLHALDPKKTHLAWMWETHVNQKMAPKAIQTYLIHLLEVYDTGCQDDALRELILKRGYRDPRASLRNQI